MEVITVGKCQSEKKVEYSYCEGTCGNSSSVPLLFDASETEPLKMKSECKCCTMKYEEYHVITFICENSKKKLMKLAKACECECKPCVSIFFNLS